MLGAETYLFGGDVVKKNLQGKYVPVGAEDFAGVSVALYFGRRNHPQCSAVVSVLKQFYLTTNGRYRPMEIEVIYVSMDEDEENFEKARATMPWCSVNYNSDLRKNLISRYRIIDIFTRLRRHKCLFICIVAGVAGPAPRSMVLPPTQSPQIIVIGPHGEEAGRLDLSRTGPEPFLLNWDYHYNRWPGKATVPSSVVAWT